MSENNEPKKVSLQDAIRQKLAQKKEQAHSALAGVYDLGRMRC